MSALSRLSLSRKFTLAAVLLSFFVAGGLFAIERALSQSEGTAIQINLAGSLRWMARDILVEARRHADGLAQPHERLEALLARYEATLDALARGGVADAARVPALAPSLQTRLTELRRLWSLFRESVSDYRAQPPHTPLALERFTLLYREANQLHAAADGLTAALAAEIEAQHATIRAVPRLLALAAAAVLAYALFVLRRRIVRPIEALADTGRRFAAGDLSLRSGYRAGDEIGELAATFDEMAGEIGSRIEELTRTQMELRKLALAVEYSPASVMITDAGGVIEYVNPRFTAVTGYAAAETIGRKPSFLKAGTMNEAVYAELWQTVSAGRPWRGRLLNRRKDGQPFWEDTWIAPIRDSSGNISHYVAVKEDITEAVRLEEERARMQEELERRVAQRTSELSATVKELESFSYSVSHDLRAPLRAIHGFAHLMQEECAECDNAEAQEHLRRIQAASLRMGEIIDDLLELARISRNELRIARVDASAMAREALAALAAAEPQRQVAVFVQPGIVLRADPGMLRIALENLLGNAWKFTAGRAPAEIRVTAKQSEDETELVVADNGAGFDMAHAGKLFQPFQRLHRNEEFSGSGIGLATVARIVRLHGGRILAEAAPGRGALFRITLPCR